MRDLFCFKLDDGEAVAAVPSPSIERGALEAHAIQSYRQEDFSPRQGRTAGGGASRLLGRIFRG